MQIGSRCDIDHIYSTIYRPDYHRVNVGRKLRKRPMQSKSQNMQARLVQGWELIGLDVGIGLIFKLAKANPDGSVEIVGDIPLLLSSPHCRSLAAHLIEVADRFDGPVGSS
jgi:hypothetical protein